MSWFQEPGVTVDQVDPAAGAFTRPDLSGGAAMLVSKLSPVAGKRGTTSEHVRLSG
jgi:hypothetical protein